jgi:hypothetical protein
VTVGNVGAPGPVDVFGQLGHGAGADAVVIEVLVDDADVSVS